MLTSDFDFYLPDGLIAQRPLACRDESRLMVVDRARGTIEQEVVRLSLLSTALIVALLLIVYRSVTALILGLVPWLSDPARFGFLLAAVALGGLATQSYRPAAAVLLSDLMPEEHRVMAFSMMRIALNIGAALGPLAVLVWPNVLLAKVTQIRELRRNRFMAPSNLVCIPGIYCTRRSTAGCP